MKKRNLFLGLCTLCCTLCAYAFLFHLQMLQEADVMMNELPQQMLTSIEPAASPDVSLFKHIISVLIQLLPAA